jgi:DNA-binding NtrC family response regulator
MSEPIVVDVLAIDDDPVMRTVLRRILQGAGHRVRVVADGNQGIAAFAGKASDLVITDIFMPEQEGLAVIRAIRSIAPSVPILAISGYSSGRVDFLKLAVRFGATDSLAKPFAAETLIERVNRMLHHSAYAAHRRRAAARP